MELAQAKEENLLSAKAVSESQGIPLQYLEQIFNRLKRRGLVKTRRGSRGGYILSRHPSKIKLKNIIEALEDKGLLVDCLAGKSKDYCDRIEVCKTRGFWQRLARSITTVMNSTTLQDLCQGPKIGEKANNIEHHYLFQI